jgi:hypothetical protein
MHHDPRKARLLREIAPGESLVVVRLDRLACWVSHLLAVKEWLEAKGAHFRSLRDPIDTTATSKFSLQVLGGRRLARASADRGRTAVARSRGASVAIPASVRVTNNAARRFASAVGVTVRGLARARVVAYTDRILSGNVHHALHKTTAAGARKALRTVAYPHGGNAPSSACAHRCDLDAHQQHREQIRVASPARLTRNRALRPPCSTTSR